MNANELADELYDLDVQASQQSLNDWAEKAATMLRQQQARIEELQESERNLIGHLNNYETEHETGERQWNHAFDLAKIEIKQLNEKIKWLEGRLNIYDELKAKTLISIDNSLAILRKAQEK